MDIQQILEDKLTRKVNMLNNIKSPLVEQAESVKNTISSYSGSIYDTTALEAKVESIIPTDLGFTTDSIQIVSDIKTTAINCFGDMPFIDAILRAGGTVVDNVTAFPREIMKYVTDNFSSVLSAGMGVVGILSDVAEKVLSQAMEPIKDLLDKSGISSMFSEIDSLINCLSDEGYTDLLDWANTQLNTFVDDLNLDDLGNFNVSNYLGDIPGLNLNLQTNLTNIFDMGQEMKTEAETAITNASESVFSMIPTFTNTIDAQATNAVTTITSKLPIDWY